MRILFLPLVRYVVINSEDIITSCSCRKLIQFQTVFWYKQIVKLIKVFIIIKSLLNFFIKFISRKIESKFCSFKFLKIEFLKLFHPILFSTSTYVDNANKNHSTPVSKSIKMIKGVYVE